MLLTVLGFTLLGVGAFISLINFYQTFLRFPLYRVRGGARERYQWVSPVPMIGSALLVISAILLRDSTLWVIVAMAIAILDTGGIHWFVFWMIWHRGE